MRIVGRLNPALLVLLLLPCLGCPILEPDPPLLDGNVNVDPRTVPNMRVSGEPNDTFEEALDVVFDDADAARLSGTIGTPDDVDVYALGPLAAGDRVVIDVWTPGSLDAAMALFDEAGRIAFENDDRNLELGQLDPFVNVVLRRTSSVYFLAISAAPLGDRKAQTGSYNVNIQLARGGQPPPTAGQIILLDFTGGVITIPGDQTYAVGPFDAAEIDPAYAGLTAVIRQQVRATVVENFEGLEMDIRMTPGDPLPAPGTFSRVLFGGRNPGAFGISQQIDPYNQDHADSSIIFTNMFAPSRFGRLISPEELGIALGNVATHEIGHLLGLNHVANIADLMDTTGGANTLLLDQEFLSSPLHDTIFLIGFQDSHLLLMETLGPSR